MFSASRINLTLINWKEQVIRKKRERQRMSLDYQQYWRLLGDKRMISIGYWGRGVMDYDLKILYPVKILLYEDKKKAF